MRAARVLDMLLILQRRGRTTARSLAEELEVSERTILRDVEALSEAGVPIYTAQGPLGGIELLDGFETRLTGLTSDEARSMFLVGQPQVAHRLGLASPVRATREKLLSALPAQLAAEAETLDKWFVHDPDPWTGTTPAHGELRRLAGAIRRRRVVEISVGAAPLNPVRAVGIVLKAGSWHLVNLADEPQVMVIDQLRSTRLTNKAFVVPHDFDLRSFWLQHVRAEFDRSVLQAIESVDGL